MVNRVIEASPEATGYLQLASNLLASYVTNNQVAPAEMPGLLKSWCESMAAMDQSLKATLAAKAGAIMASVIEEKTRTLKDPAVPVEESIKENFLICLEDGKPMKMLKRYLMTRYGMTPDEYRLRWGLPEDYPMTAPNISEKRSVEAKGRGLGKPRSPAGQ